MKPRKTHAPSTSKRRRPDAAQREFDFGTLTRAVAGIGRLFAPAPAPLPAAPASPEAADRELTRTARALLVAIGETLLSQSIRVRWNPRLRSTAGRAYRGRNLVELNPSLLGVDAGEVDRTLRHELAHLVAYRRARKRRIDPHGPEWRAACADLGIAGENRCHTLDLPRTRQRRQFAYACLHCGREIRRVRRIRAQVACFHCCKAHNHGRFSAVFALQERRLGEVEENS